MPCYVNLPLSWVAHNERWLDWFIASSVSPELGMDLPALTQSPSWHRSVAARLRDAGLGCAVHLPFSTLSPGSPDAKTAERSRTCLLQAAALAAEYGAGHMVGHPDFTQSRDCNGEAPLENDPVFAAWRERSEKLWRQLPELGQAPLYLENTHDPHPHALRLLVSSLASEHIGVCFDAGHWHCFADGVVTQDLPHWVAVLAPYIRHLHLHDNDGHSDQHLGLGQGAMPLEQYFDLLHTHTVRPGATLEPHHATGFMDSAAWLAQNPAIARFINWQEPQAAWDTSLLPRH